MTDPEIIKKAGKRIAAHASGRAYKEEDAALPTDQAPTAPERPKNREVEDEMLKIPQHDGEPPKPATEPGKYISRGT